MDNDTSSVIYIHPNSLRVWVGKGWHVKNDRYCVQSVFFGVSETKLDTPEDIKCALSTYGVGVGMSDI